MKPSNVQESEVDLDRAVSLGATNSRCLLRAQQVKSVVRYYQQARPDAERALNLQDPSGFVVDLHVYYSYLSEHEFARKDAELSKTTTVPNSESSKELGFLRPVGAVGGNRSSTRGTKGPAERISWGITCESDS